MARLVSRSGLAVSLLAPILLAGCAGEGSTQEQQEEALEQPSAEARVEIPPTEARPPAGVVVGGEVEANTADAPKATRGHEVADKYTRMFYEGELDTLHEKFSPEMRLRLPLAGLQALSRSQKTEYGPEVAVVGEDSAVKGDYRAFVRWARFERFDGVIEIKWILREDDSVAGFFFEPVRTNK